MTAEARSQGPDTVSHKLLYVVDAPTAYLVPYIEKRLKNIKYANSDRKMFDSVASLNYRTQRTSIEAIIIRNLIDNRLLTPERARPHQQHDTIQQYSDIIQQYDFVLIIKINTYSPLLEFQFTLFGVDSTTELKYINSMSVFIDPQKPHYQSELIRTLNQVFIQASRAPVIKMQSNKEDRKTGNTYYITPDDSLSLTPIIESDNPEDDRQYFWRQSPDDKVALPIDKASKDQPLNKLDTGSYTLYFSLNDGIYNSRIDTVRIKVAKKPYMLVKSDPFISDSSAVIQQTVFSDFHCIQFPDYQIQLDPVTFLMESPEFIITLQSYDHKELFQKTVTLTGQALPTERLVIYWLTYDSIKEELDQKILERRRKINGKYYLTIQAKTSRIQSQVSYEILKIKTESIITPELATRYFPFDRKTDFSSSFYVGPATDVRMTQDLSFNIGYFFNTNGHYSGANYLEIAPGWWPARNIEIQPVGLINLDNHSKLGNLFGMKISAMGNRDMPGSPKFSLGLYGNENSSLYFSMGLDFDFNIIH